MSFKDTEISSDFDYSALFSDSNINNNKNQIEGALQLSSSLDLEGLPDYEDEGLRCVRIEEEDSFSDDIEAIGLVDKERKEGLCKKGVVIQHRVRDEVKVFRSSSLPPGIIEY